MPSTCSSLYSVLGVSPKASAAEIRQAYIQAARQQHPDKGGDAEAFGRVQQAWSVLGNPQTRAVYDTHALHAGQHHVQAPRAQGGEDALLWEIAAHARPGSLDPRVQLVLTCETCGRPATRTCSVCSGHVCTFCVRRQHWKGSFGLHWPVVVTKGQLSLRLAQQEFERKRIEDARRREARAPDFRTPQQLALARECTTTALLAAEHPQNQVRYEPALARFWMWAQTDTHLHLAVHMPTGRASSPPQVQLQQHGSTGHTTLLLAAAAGEPPLMHRRLSAALCSEAAVKVARSGDGRYLLLSMVKALPGQAWSRLCEGDPWAARCMEQPYVLHHTGPEEVVLELDVAWWTEAEDVCVEVTGQGLHIGVRGGISLSRTFWRNSEAEARRPDTYAPIMADECVWSLSGSGPMSSSLQQQQAQRPGSQATGAKGAVGRVGVGADGGAAGAGSAGRMRPTAAQSVRSMCDVDEQGKLVGKTVLPVAAAVSAEGAQPEEATAVVQCEEQLEKDATVVDQGIGECISPRSQSSSRHATSARRDPSSNRGSASCDEQGAGAGVMLAGKQRRRRTLMLTLPRPPLTDEEVTYKKGVRQDHAAAGRHLFLEDDDAWGLEALLQAGCMLQAGRAPLRRAPNDANVPQVVRWVSDAMELPLEARRALTWIEAATSRIST